ncbi:MAG: hypothetical protein ACYTEZ_19330 [Planctomycetota bacterium]|jgi:hypothetical protein
MPAPKKKGRRWLRRGVVIVVVLVGGLAAALPSILSTGAARSRLLASLNASLPGTVRAADLDFRWSGGQTATGLELADPAGRRVLRCARLHAEVSLLGLLTGSYDLGKVEVVGLEVDLVRDDGGRLNLAAALARDAGEEPAARPLAEVLRELELSLPPSLRCVLDARDARVTYRDPGLEQPVVYAPLDLGLVLAGPEEPAALRCDGRFRQEPRLDGALAVRATLQGLDASQRLAVARPGTRLAVEATWQGRGAERVVGPALETRLEVAASATGFAFEVVADGERLALAGAGEAAFFAPEPAQRRLTLTRPLSLAWKPDSGLLVTGGDVELPAEIPLGLTIEALDAPLAGERLWTRLGGRARLTLADGRGRVPFGGRLRDLAWRGWRAEFSSASLGTRVRVDVAGRLASAGKEGSLALEGVAADLSDPEAARVDAVARLRDFPLEPLDGLVGRLTGRKGLLRRALGERIDLEVRTTEATQGRVVMRVEAKSEHFEAKGPLDLDLAALALRSEGFLARWDVSPEVVKSLVADATPLRLRRAVPVRLDVGSLATRLERFDPAATTLAASLSIGDGALVDPAKGDEVAWRGLAARIDAPRLTGALTLRAQGEILHDDQRTTIDVNGNVARLWRESGAFEPHRLRGEATARLEKIPTRAVVRALRLPEQVADALGGRCDVEVSAKGGTEAALARLLVRSPQIDAVVPLRLGEEITVGPEAVVRGRVPPDLVHALVPALALEGDAALVLVLPGLELPAPWSAGPWRPSAIRGEARLRAEALVVSGLVPNETVRIDDLSARLLCRPEAAFDLTCRLAGTRPRTGLDRTLGGPLDVRLEGQVDLDEARAETLRLQLESALLRLRAAARVDQDRRLVLADGPAVLDYRVPPGLGGETQLAAPAPLRVEVRRLEVPLAGFDRSAIAARAEVVLPAATLRSGARFEDVRLTAEVGKDLAVDGGGKVTRPGPARAFTLRARVSDWTAGATSWRAHVEHLPVALVEALAGEEGLVALIGEEASVELRADRDEGGTYATRCTVRTARLTLDAEGSVGETVALARPATARWTLTPAAWARIAAAPALAGPATLEARIERLGLSAGRDRRFDWAGLALRAVVSIPEAALRNPRGKDEANLRQMQVTAATDERTGALEVRCDGRVEGPETPGRVDATLRLEEPARLLGHVLADRRWAQVLELPPPRRAATGVRDSVFGDGELHLESVPVWILDGLLDLEEHGVAVLGAHATATVRAELKGGNGPVRITVRSPQAQGEARALLTPRGLTLAEPLAAELKPSKELGKLVLPKLGPFFRGLESAEQPISLRVPAKGFLLPLDPFDLRQVQVPSATVDVGRVVLNNLWLTDILKTVTRTWAPGKRTTAWFTPLELEFRDGVIRYGRRLDLLSEETMHLACWGEVDLARNRVDLTFAFMAEALRKHLRIRRARDGDTLRIPIRGTVDQPKVEYGHVLGDLAKIQLREKALAQIGDPLGRMIAERALEGVFRGVLRGGAVPAASADPLPWIKPVEEEPR